MDKAYGQIPEIRTLIEFLGASDRGRMGRARESNRPPARPSDPEADAID